MMRMLSSFRFLGRITGVLLISISTSFAQVTCHEAHNTSFFSFAERGRVEKRVVSDSNASPIKGASDEVLHAFPGGSLFIREKALPSETKEAVMELIRLWTYTRQIEFPAKELKNKQTLTLGLPLGNGYSVELVYRANTRNENIDSQGPQKTIEDKFSLIEVHGAGPEGVYLKGAGQVRDIKGNLTQRQILDLTDLPGISNFDFLANVPSEISGAALKTFQELAPKLEFFRKQELWDLARTDSYYKLKFKAVQRNVVESIKGYHFKGIGKSIVKYASIPVLLGSLWMGGKAIAPDLFRDGLVVAQKAVAIDNNSWIQSGLSRMGSLPSITAPIREQVQLLKLDFQKAVDNDSLFMPLTEKYPFSLENQSRYQLSHEEYIWVQRSFDKAENKEVTLFYMAQVSAKTGRVYVAVAPVDGNKYQALIQFLENQGEFTVPLRAGATP